jgi:threonine/homoserine/homoserine lactone efflux protein
MAPDRGRGYLRGMKATLVMLATVALVVILMAGAVRVFGEHNPYLIVVGVAGAAILAYAGCRWKQKLGWTRDAN